MRSVSYRANDPSSVVGIIIPTLNEAHRLPALLEDLQELALALEVIVVDGGSRDKTAALAHAGGARVLSTCRGRARRVRRQALHRSFCQSCETWTGSRI